MNGNFYDGKWSKGLKHGEGIYVFKEKGQFMEGVWVYGVPKINMIKYFDDYNYDDQKYHDDQNVTKLNSLIQQLDPVIPEVRIFIQFIMNQYYIIMFIL